MSVLPVLLQAALCAGCLAQQSLAAPMIRGLVRRADESRTEESKSKSKDSKEEESSIKEYSKIEVGGVPLYIILLMVTGALLLLLGGVFWYRRNQKQKKYEKREEQAAAEQAEVDRRTGGMPISEEEFGEEGGDGRDFDEKQGDPNFLQVR